jgi:capsular polysaccharide biosynthesis protein
MTDQNQKNTSVSQVEEDEIDFIAIAKTFWKGRKKILKTTLIFMALGLFVAIFSEKEYTASTTFVPQTSEGKKIGGGLSGLAAIAGINLGSIGGNTGTGISPLIYPNLINNVSFQKELLQTSITIKGIDDSTSFERYYTEIYNPSLLGYIKKYTIGLPGLIIKTIKGNSDDVNLRRVDGAAEKSEIIAISMSEKKLFEILDGCINIDINEDDGYVYLTATMPEALPSAQLAINAQKLLEKYIINFKIQKSNEQLKFIEERYIEKEQEFKRVQKKLAKFRDQNQGFNSAMAQTSIEVLQSEYDLAYNVFTELAKQLEKQKIQVKENTPVFTIIDPVYVPVEKSKPKRFSILIIWSFIGIFFGIVWIFGKGSFFKLKDEWNKA